MIEAAMIDLGIYIIQFYICMEYYCIFSASCYEQGQQYNFIPIEYQLNTKGFQFCYIKNTIICILLKFDAIDQQKVMQRAINVCRKKSLKVQIALVFSPLYSFKYPLKEKLNTFRSPLMRK